MLINFLELESGDRVLLRDGSIAEVIENIGDGIWVNCRIVQSAEGSSDVGEEELCHCESVLKKVVS